mmetsp:Transcript_27378/g.79862  ORF Transcript_27378/g.79862 Transcript_27378/m.79862 type:complete len:235 (+) Transcript_27378:1359-2063(+)
MTEGGQMPSPQAARSTPATIATSSTVTRTGEAGQPASPVHNSTKTLSHSTDLHNVSYRFGDGSKDSERHGGRVCSCIQTTEYGHEEPTMEYQPTGHSLVLDHDAPGEHWRHQLKPLRHPLAHTKRTTSNSPMFKKLTPEKKGPTPSDQRDDCTPQDHKTHKKEKGTEVTFPPFSHTHTTQPLPVYNKKSQTSGPRGGQGTPTTAQTTTTTTYPRPSSTPHSHTPHCPHPTPADC